MNTETRRKASADYHAKRKEAGWKKVTFWLAPEHLGRLAELKAVHGSNDAAIQAWLAPPSTLDIPMEELVGAALQDMRAKTTPSPLLKHLNEQTTQSFNPPSVKIDYMPGEALVPRYKAPKEEPLDDASVGPQRPKPGSLLKRR